MRTRLIALTASAAMMLAACFPEEGEQSPSGTTETPTLTGESGPSSEPTAEPSATPTASPTASPVSNAAPERPAAPSGYKWVTFAGNIETVLPESFTPSYWGVFKSGNIEAVCSATSDESLVADGITAAQATAVYKGFWPQVSQPVMSKTTSYSNINGYDHAEIFYVLYRGPDDNDEDGINPTIFDILEPRAYMIVGSVFVECSAHYQRPTSQPPADWHGFFPIMMEHLTILDPDKAQYFPWHPSGRKTGSD